VAGLYMSLDLSISVLYELLQEERSAHEDAGALNDAGMTGGDQGYQPCYLMLV